MDVNEFNVIMCDLCQYYSKVLNPTEKKYWFENFKDFKPETFKNKISEHIKTSTNPFFPTIGEIREIFVIPTGSIG